MAGHPLAVLIDGENVAASRVSVIMEKARELGSPTTRCVVGDFSANRLAEWVKVAPNFALDLIFQPSCGKGRNSADIALTIRAMDLLGTNVFRSFLLVSSDSDFAPLAQRLGRSGVAVFGMGKARPDSLWRAACTEFFDLDGAPSSMPGAVARTVEVKPAATRQAPAAPRTATPQPVAARPATARPPSPVAAPGPSRQDIEAVRAILRQATAAGPSWVPLSRLGTLIRQSSTPLGARVCGNGRLTKALRADPLVVLRGEGSATEAALLGQPCSGRPPAAVPVLVVDMRA
jgi:uncharacterized LabA/DUF88 family protein